jgi:hypothetical protein
VLAEVPSSSFTSPLSMAWPRQANSDAVTVNSTRIAPPMRTSKSITDWVMPKALRMADFADRLPISSP